MFREFWKPLEHIRNKVFRENDIMQHVKHAKAMGLGSGVISLGNLKLSTLRMNFVAIMIT